MIIILVDLPPLTPCLAQEQRIVVGFLPCTLLQCFLPSLCFFSLIKQELPKITDECINTRTRN